MRGVREALERAGVEPGEVSEVVMGQILTAAQGQNPARQASIGAGVPVEVASDEVPLVRDPAVLPLLDAVRAVVHLDDDDPDHVDFVHPSRAESLLLSPIGETAVIRSQVSSGYVRGLLSTGSEIFSELVPCPTIDVSRA